MAFARNGSVKLHWRADGMGRPLLLLNSVGCDLSLWDGVMPHLADFRVLRMDMRGHGGSDSPKGEYALDELAGDALSVLEAAGEDKAAICGLSLGGMTAMSTALRAPDRVSALVLACTSAAMDPESWNARAATVRRNGMEAIAETVMARFFTETFRRDHPDVVEGVRARFLRIDPSGYAGCCAAIRDMALLDRIAAITAPTLVIAGDRDVATPFCGHGDKIQERIAGARAAVMPCGHLAPVELPAPFAVQLKTFLSGEHHG
jgi:3-oxoadipate enol-lactonase / 4-carboxymuconolactone decarboxylase